MKNNIIIYGLAGVIAVIGMFTVYAGSSGDVDEIIEKIDELYRSNTSYAEMEMEIITPHWERTLAMKAWTEGMEKTFIRITAPAKEKGVSTLRIENEMWNYLPKTNKVIKVPPSMMMSSWMGSDFTNDDLVSEFTFTEDYHFHTISADSIRDDRILIEAIPKEDRPIVWGKVFLYIQKSDTLPVREEFYDEKGRLMRLMKFKEVKNIDDRRIPSVMILIPQDEEGNKTILRYRKVDFNRDIPSDIFSLRHLRSR